jgi:alcohol dehydrogenase class IV
MIGGTFRTPFIAYGEGVSQKLGEYCMGLGKNGLIVTDAILDKIGILSGLKESLGVAKIEFTIFDQVTTEPVVKYVEEGLRVFKENRCDLLISVGGGSCIDTAKGISILATNRERLPDLEGMNRIRNPGIPHVAVPTTAGTGSEVSPTTIIADPDRNVKMLLMSPHLGTRVAIVDPLLTIQMPQHVTASSGLDALTHAIEGYVSTKAHSVTDALTLHAIQLISQNLPQAWSDGNNIAARTNMMIGALESGIGFCNSSVALVHGMARPLGAYFHVPHGLANAVLLPVVMEFTVLGNPPKFADIARAMGENTEGLSIMDAASLSVKAVKRLKEHLNIPSINGLGISLEDFNRVVEQMSKDALVGGSAGFNPRKATPKEILELYRKSF